jgi:hypothetical protein
LRHVNESINWCKIKKQDRVAKIVAEERQGKKGTSLVYQHAEKRQVKCAAYFFCLVEINKTSKKCGGRFETKDGSTRSLNI